MPRNDRLAPAAQMASAAHGGMTALLFATMFPQAAVSMISLSPPVLASAVGETYGLPAELTGLYTGLVYGFVLLGNLFSAPLINRFGPLRLSFACILGAGAGLALFGLGGIAGIAIGTIMIGLFYGPLTPSSSQAISHHAGSPAFAFIVSVRQMSVPLGGVLAGLLVPPLLLRIGWGQTCVVLAAASAIAAIAFAFLSPLTRRERPQRGSARRRRLLEPLTLVIRHRGLLNLSCASMIFGAVQLISSSFLVIYLVTVVGNALVSAGALLSASQVAGMISRPAWGYVADRSGSSRGVLVGLGFGMAACCILTAALALLGPSWVALPVVVAFGATATGWNGVFLAEIMREVDPAEIGLATSGGLLFTYAGIALGPPAFGALAAAIGFVASFAVLALVALVGGLLLLPRRRLLPSAEGP